VGLFVVRAPMGRPADQIAVLGHHRIKKFLCAAGQTQLSEVQQQATGQRQTGRLVRSL